MYLPAVTSSGDNVLDLINDAARLETDLTGSFEFDMLLGDEIKDMTALQFDFTGLIADFIGTYAASGEKQECVVTCPFGHGTHRRYDGTGRGHIYPRCRACGFYRQDSPHRLHRTWKLHELRRLTVFFRRSFSLTRSLFFTGEKHNFTNDRVLTCKMSVL